MAACLTPRLALLARRLSAASPPTLRLRPTSAIRSSLPLRNASGSDADARDRPARLVQMECVLEEAVSRSSGNEGAVPKVTVEHVTVSFARSSGPGGQNVNKVNTKVDMRFNVMDAHWLSDRVKQKLTQMEKNRINCQGELVITSSKTRTQKGNIKDALSRLQEIIDAASYIPPPPSDETKKKIDRLAKVENERRLSVKRKSSIKKANRSAGVWD